MSKEWNVLTDGLFTADTRIFSTRIMGRNVDFMATALVDAQVSGVGPCTGGRGVHDSAVSWAGTLKVDGSVVTYVRPRISQKHTREMAWFKRCVSAKFLQACISVGGTVAVDLQTGAQMYPRKSLEKDYANFKVEVWAVGSVSVWWAEAGVRSFGTLLDMRTENHVTMDTNKMRVSTTYKLYPMRFQIGLAWRYRAPQYNRRRRWYGSVGFALSSWKTIKVLFDEEWNGISGRRSLLAAHISLDELSEVLYAGEEAGDLGACV